MGCDENMSISGKRPGIWRKIFKLLLPLAFLALGVIGYREIIKPQTEASGPGESADKAKKNGTNRKGPWGPRYGRSGTLPGKKEKKPVPVAAWSVRLAPYKPVFHLYGQIIASHKVVLGLPVSGQITSVNPELREGAWVEKGDLLISIDAFPYEAALEEQRASLAEAEAKTREIRAQLQLETRTLEQVRRQLDLAMRERQRAEKLIARGTVSQKMLDDANLLVSQRKVAVEQRRSNIKIIKARIEQQQAMEKRLGWAVKKARRTLRDTKLYAPFDGRILLVNAENGQFVSSSDKLVTIVSDSHLEVRFTLSEDRYGDLLASGSQVTGLPVRITWKSGRTTLSFEGEVTRLAPEIEAQSGAVIGFARFSRKSAAPNILRIGSFVDVELSGKQIENIARIPETALYDKSKVYLIKDGRLVMKKVQPLAWEDANVLVASDIEEGEEILASHLPNIKPDMRVKVVRE